MTAHAVITAPPIAHGGRLDAARKRFPQALQPWIDLSTGVNPHAYPLPPLPSSAFTQLPDDDAFSACEGAARHAYGVAPAIDIVIGAGAQHFIQMLPRVFPARRVAVLGYTYAEHAACWAASGAKVETVEALEALADADAGVIVNPNNPDGRLVSPRDIASIAARMAKHGAMLVVDESFMDFTPTQSVASLSLDNVIVLRSFGKAYGLPGLRLGFALCAPRRAAMLRAALGPWAVSGPALTAGAKALADTVWRDEAVARCAQDAERLNAMLVKAAFEIVGGTSLYRLAAHDGARRHFACLVEHGVLTRNFPERPEWLRIGLPSDADAWSRLAQALEAAHD